MNDDDKKPQIDKFRETARELECDESEEAFERKLKKVARVKGGCDEGPISSHDS